MNMQYNPNDLSNYSNQQQMNNQQMNMQYNPNDLSNLVTNNK